MKRDDIKENDGLAEERSVRNGTEMPDGTGGEKNHDDESRTVNPGSDSDDSELETLRREVDELKRLLAQSRITNERVLRRSMRDQSGWLVRLVKLEIWSLPFIILVLLGFSYAIGASLWPVVVCLVMGAVSTWLDWYTLRIAPSNVLDMPMLELKGKLVKQKRQRLIQTVVESVLTFIWLGWYLYSVKIALSPGSEFDRLMKYTVFGGAITGGAVAVIAIVIIYRRAQKTNNELIDSIDASEN